MKNITVSVDEETYRNARVEAAKQNTSVSELVRRYLRELAKGESEWDRLTRLEMQVRERIKGFDPTDNVPRDELYRR